MDRDLAQPWLMVLKAVLFAGCVVLASALLWVASPSTQTLLLTLVVSWASARAYYFVFYVLERYVDPRLRYPGVWALLRRCVFGATR